MFIVHAVRYLLVLSKRKLKYCGRIKAVSEQSYDRTDWSAPLVYRPCLYVTSCRSVLFSWLEERKFHIWFTIYVSMLPHFSHIVATVRSMW